jgi:hypothetical protein
MNQLALIIQILSFATLAVGGDMKPVAEVKRLGGEVTFDKAKPDEVVEVSFARARIRSDVQARRSSNRRFILEQQRHHHQPFL